MGKRRELLAAGRALVVAAPVDGSPFTLIEPGQHFYVVKFVGPDPQVIHSGTYKDSFRGSNGLAISGTRLTRDRMLVMVVWDGGRDGDPSRFAAERCGLHTTANDTLLALADLDGIFWTDGRNTTEREALHLHAPLACSCGAKRPDGQRCPDWPDCVIP